jgi:IclR helix-turn-helix domain
MTYLKGMTEYLTPDDKRVWDAVQYLAGQGRTTNNSQVAEVTGLPRTRVRQIATQLRRRNYLRDASPAGCAAYHWRITDKPAITEDWTPAEAVSAACAAGEPGDCTGLPDGSLCEHPNHYEPEPELWTPERAANPDILASYGGELIGGPVAYTDRSCIQFPDVHSASSWAEATCMRQRVSFATLPVNLTNPVRIWLDHKQSGR